MINFNAENVSYIRGRGLIFVGLYPTKGKSLVNKDVLINGQIYTVVAVESQSYGDFNKFLGKIPVGLVVRHPRIRQKEDLYL